MTKKKHNRTVSKLRAGKRSDERDLDKIWEELVKKRDGRCRTERDDCEGGLDAHHFVTRKNMNTRYLIENGVTLCRKHHRTAHDNIEAARVFFSRERTKEERDILHAAARTISTLKGKEYINFWREYLLKEKEKMG